MSRFPSNFRWKQRKMSRFVNNLWIMIYVRRDWTNLGYFPRNLDYGILIEMFEILRGTNKMVTQSPHVMLDLGSSSIMVISVSRYT